MGIYVCIFLVISTIIFMTKRDLMNPVFLFSVAIALYGFAGIYLAYDTAPMGQFDQATIHLGFNYGLLIYVAFLGGCALRSLNKKSIGVEWLPAGHGDGENSLPFVSIPTEINICLAAICAGGVILLMLLSSEGVYEFITNLHLRQVSTRGYNWLMFFILAGRLPINNALCRLIKGEKNSLIIFTIYAVPLTTLIGLAAGRQFALLILLQAYITYSKFRPVSTYRKLLGLFAAIIIFFVYGFIRYFQGMEGGADAIDFREFLFGETQSQNQNFTTVMETVMFDGWYILLSVVDATGYSADHGNGALILSSLAKLVPGLYDQTMDALYPDYSDIVEQYDLKYRAMSFCSEVWLDFGWFGIGIFAIFGYFSMQLYQRLKADSAGLWETVILSTLFTYLFIMIRNGIGWFIAYVSIEMLWFLIVLGFMNVISGSNYAGKGASPR